MNIWFIHHYAVPPDRSGGTRHFSVARELVRQGHRVTIVASSYHYQTMSETTEFDEHGESRSEYEGVEFLWVRTTPYRGNSVRRLLNMASFATAALRSAHLSRLPRPDVILGSSPHPFAALAAQVLARRHGCRFVYEVRDIWPQTLVELGRIPAWHPLIVAFAWIERWCCRRADHVITLLPHSTAHLVARGADAARVTCVPNGVDLAMAGPPTPPAEADTVTVMYAGAHGHANGLDILLRAAARLAGDPRAQRVRFRLVGDGPELPALKTLAAQLDARNVAFEPIVAKHEVYARLREADVFVMLLRDSPVFQWGISPNKLFDYMSVARPIVFAVNTPTNIVAEAGAGASADPNDVEQLAEAILALASLTPAERWELGQRGRRYVETHHEIGRLAQRYGVALTGAGVPDVSGRPVPSPA